MQLYLNNIFEIGVDEAGRGPLLGRVYASAVILGDKINTNDIMFTYINDSKKLSRKKRNELLPWIESNVYAYGIGYAEVDEIEKYNILGATRLAMERAIDNIKDKNNTYSKNTSNIIIDGTGWEKYFPNSKSIIGGDSKYVSIACASIIAKEYHDKYIYELCDNNSELDIKYGIKNNMGYGTKKHIEGIKEHGISQYHRKSFLKKYI